MSELVLTPDGAEEVWKKACKILQSQLTSAVYSTWIVVNPLSQLLPHPTQPGFVASITCASAFHATNLKRNLYPVIKSALEEVLHQAIELDFSVGSPLITQSSNQGFTAVFSSNSSQPNPSRNSNSQAGNQNLSEPSPSHSSGFSQTVTELFSTHNLQSSMEDRAVYQSKKVGLRPDYTFETFAVSTSNEMAHAAAVAVSKNPGTAYNPLFLYGGVGVGKTHLMQSVGHNIIRQDPNKSQNIIYCTGEEFTNDIVSAIQSKKTLNFKHKYRNTQVLLIDDIQFIAGKNAVQEEFFHTFNALIKDSAQIILTSDRPPHEISLLEDRLRSRFEAGLIVDIQQPSFELRTAIILIKAKAHSVNLPMDIAQKIAAQIDSARKLEGIINQIKSEVQLKKRSLSIELIDELLKNEVSLPRPILRVKPEDIIKTVANHFRVKQAAIRGHRRTKDLVVARHVAMFILRSELKLPLEEIGRWFSGRDHTSVLHATEKIEHNLKDNLTIQQDVSALRTSLLSLSH